MPPSPFPRVLLVLAVLAGSGSTLAASPGMRLAGQGGGATSAAQAAEQVRRQTGGKVLSVREKGGGYEVKVLTPSGEVRSVFIPASGR
jgi:hypothetical protein